MVEISFSFKEHSLVLNAYLSSESTSKIKSLGSGFIFSPHRTEYSFLKFHMNAHIRLCIMNE